MWMTLLGVKDRSLDTAYFSLLMGGKDAETIEETKLKANHCKLSVYYIYIWVGERQ